MRLFLALFLLLVSTLSQADSGSVHIVLSDNSKLYQQAAEDIHADLLSRGVKNSVVISTAESLENTTIQPSDLIVALGQKAVATSHYSFTQNTRLYSFLDKTQLPSPPQNQWTAIVIDQPLQRLFDVAETIISGRYRDKVVVAVSDDNRVLREEIAALKNQSGIELEVVVVDENTEPAKIIDKALFNAGALLAIRDNRIWSGENAKWMLYQSYKFNVPVVGYSKRFLKAGALVSVYATLAQTVHKTSQLIMHWSQQGTLSEQGIVYPNYDIEFNKNIARALKITIPDVLPEGEKTDVRD